MQPSSSLFTQPAWVVYHQLPSCKKILVQVGHCVCVFKTVSHEWYL